MTIRVFIDGEAGTTGLQIRTRLEARPDLELTHLDDAVRKDPATRAEALNSADIVILCLPDGAAKEAVALIENPNVRVIDASTAHRVADGWTYGLPELDENQREIVAASKRVSNPGCYPTGAISLIRPLVREGLLPADWPVSVNAVSGYSGGGKSLIGAFEDETSADFTTDPYRIYALSLAHKHVPEMQVHAGLARNPLFAPSVGRFYQGMIVEVPLQLWALPSRVAVVDIQEVLAAAYRDCRYVSVASLAEARSIDTLDPEGLNGSNDMRLYVFGNEDQKQVRLVALLDNLGKGASGAAVQNLNLMMGLDETEGLAPLAA